MTCAILRIMPQDGLRSAIRRLVPREIRNWLRSPRKTATWIWHSAQFKFGFNEEFKLPTGEILACHPTVYRTAVKAQVEDPEQSAEFSQFISYCRPGMSLFDIGASFGMFSLACAKLGGTAVALDPSHIATAMVKKQLRLNNLEASVKVMECAVGDTEGSIEMVSSGIFSDGYLKYESGRERRELRRVPLTTVDRLCEKLGYPSHLKIDVEGFEAAVIRGSRELLEHHAPLIFLELHNEMVKEMGGDIAFCVNALTSLNYKIFSVEGSPLSVDEALRPSICRILAKRA